MNFCIYKLDSTRANNMCENYKCRFFIFMFIKLTPVFNRNFLSRSENKSLVTSAAFGDAATILLIVLY